MKTILVPCHHIRYKEFPDLLFGTSQGDRPYYFDATHFIRSRSDERKHNVREFRTAFHYWIASLSRIYGIDTEDLFVQDEASGHILVDDCLALLFVVYIEPDFGAYMLERLSEMMTDGISVSDTWLIRAVSLRFTSEELTQILEHHETKQF